MTFAPLADWNNFYVIAGSSAGGLTGLTFVVIALAADVQRVDHARHRLRRADATPRTRSVIARREK
jgi:hypothetical protein